MDTIGTNQIYVISASMKATCFSTAIELRKSVSSKIVPQVGANIPRVWVLYKRKIICFFALKTRI